MTLLLNKWPKTIAKTMAFIVEVSTSTVSTSICDHNTGSQTWWSVDGDTIVGRKKAEPPTKVSFDVVSDPKTILPLDGV